MAQKEAAEAFWDFALGVYGQDAVRAAFLRLQDRDGADVPLLLWCLWLGTRGRGVSDEEMTAAVRFSLAWRDAVVAPVRAVRRGLKLGVEGVPLEEAARARARIADTEQGLERMQMDHLAQMPCSGGTDESAGLIALYAGIAGLHLDSVDVADVLASLAEPAPRA